MTPFLILLIGCLALQSSASYSDLQLHLKAIHKLATRAMATQSKLPEFMKIQSRVVTTQAVNCQTHFMTELLKLMNSASCTTLFIPFAADPNNCDGSPFESQSNLANQCENPCFIGMTRIIQELADAGCTTMMPNSVEACGPSQVTAPDGSCKNYCTSNTDCFDACETCGGVGYCSQDHAADMADTRVMTPYAMNFLFQAMCSKHEAKYCFPALFANTKLLNNPNAEEVCKKVEDLGCCWPVMKTMVGAMINQKELEDVARVDKLIETTCASYSANFATNLCANVDPIDPNASWYTSAGNALQWSLVPVLSSLFVIVSFFVL